MTGNQKSDKRGYVPGITLASVLGLILALLLTSCFVQIAEVLVTMKFPAEHTLAVPVVAVFLAMVFCTGLVFLLTKVRIFSRGEQLCMLFAMLIACPLMTQGFWHRIVSILATVPVEREFAKIDALSDKLWPHGPNLLEGVLGPDRRGEITVSGQCSWQQVEIDDGSVQSLPVLEGQSRDQVSSLQIRLPVGGDGKLSVEPGEPYLVTLLARCETLAPGSYLFARATSDQGSSSETEFFRTRTPPRETFIHKRGFVREGAYGVQFPKDATGYVVLEIGLHGMGRVVLSDPKILNVSALYYAYSGKKIVGEAEYQTLSPGEQAGLLVKPDNMLSLNGLKFVCSGYIPLGQWLRPLAYWFAFFVLVLTSTFCVAVIMRRQWAESERYPMPMTRIPLALLGDESDDENAMPSIWRNQMMWIGLGVSLVWCLLRAWNFYNPKVPNLNISVPMADYFQDPGYGKMWQGVVFNVSAIFLSLAIFMELTVLLSLVAGFFIYRSQFWLLGEALGFKAYDKSLFADQQLTGAYIAYAVLVLIFTRKYLWRVLKAAVSRDRSEDQGEALSYRTALLTLALTVVGSFVWARMAGVGAAGIVALFLFLNLVLFVGMKLRVECGTPFGYFAIFNGMIILSMLGGMERFGASSVLTCLLINFMVFPTVFCIIPGAQFELVELGRRFRVQPRHIALTVLIGVVGGLAFGGWPFLSNAYSMGGNSFPYAWAMRTKTWAFQEFNIDLASATARMTQQPAVTAAAGATGAEKATPKEGSSDSKVNPRTWAYVIPGGVMLGLTLLRQFHAGFWFHPLGYLAGMTGMMTYIWGSCLMAWAIRYFVLRLGGAVTVRTRLLPFFVGVFIGAIVAQVFITGHGLLLMHGGEGLIYTEMP